MSGRLTIVGLDVRLGERCAVAALNLSLGRGLTALVGPNGAGKTSLLRAIAGLVPHDGTIELCGRPLAGLGRAERARRIAYLAQGGSVTWPIPVRDVVALGRLPHGASPQRLPAEDEAKVARAMARTDVSAFADRAATALSGGEQARVLLARALAVEAEILLADEPVAALDPAHRLMVMEALQAEAAAGRMVVVALHDLALAARYADEVVVMGAGRMVAQGVPLSVFRRPEVAEAFAVDLEIAASDEGPVLTVGRRRGLPPA